MKKRMKSEPSELNSDLMAILEKSSYPSKIKIEYEKEKSPLKLSTPLLDYEKIKKMRTDKNAPVDLYGSHLQADPDVDKETQGFQILVSILLSVQTKDQITDLVMKRLKLKGLSVDFINEIEPKELKNLIFEINFNNNKVKYLKNLAKVIKNKYNYVMPKTYEEIRNLQGVGHKVAIIYMQSHLNQNVGIAVDTHVHRIANRLNWCSTKIPDQTRIKLEEIFEKNDWKELNIIVVGFGQMICLPVGPKCQECLLNQTCREGIINLKPKKRINKK